MVLARTTVSEFVDQGLAGVVAGGTGVAPGEGTAVFIPLEVYELLERVTWLRVAALALNVFAVIYILWTKRLFGFRGGRAAFEAERHSESLLEVERAAA